MYQERDNASGALFWGIRIYSVLLTGWYEVTQGRRVNNNTPSKKMDCGGGRAKKRPGIRDAFRLAVEKMPPLFRVAADGGPPPPFLAFSRSMVWPISMCFDVTFVSSGVFTKGQVACRGNCTEVRWGTPVFLEVGFRAGVRRKTGGTSGSPPCRGREGALLFRKTRCGAPFSFWARLRRDREMSSV